MVPETKGKSVDDLIDLFEESRFFLKSSCCGGSDDYELNTQT